MKNKVSHLKQTSVRLALFSIILLMLMVNGLGVMAIDPLASLMIETSILQRIDAISVHSAVRIANQVVPSLIMILLLTWYMLPLFRRLWSGIIKGASLDSALVRRLLNLPFFGAFLISSGWLFGVSVIPLAAPFYQVSLGKEFFIQYLSHSFVLFGFSFVISYYVVEVIVRKILIPAFIEENQALQASARLSLSISARLAVFAAAAFAVPLVLFFSTLRILNNGGLNHFDRDLMPILVVAIPLLILLITLITWLKSLSIQSPLLEITKAAKRVEQGDFNARVTVTSTDEIGQLAGAFNQMAQGLAEREKMYRLFGQIVDPRVRDRLISDMEKSGEDQEQGELREATVVFFDLAGFTGLSEQLSPQKVVYILNLYFEAVTRSVESVGGMVNKFIGDGVLAVFGAPVNLEHHQKKALGAISHFVTQLEEINTRMHQNHLPSLSVRAGVHTGEVLAGTVGSGKRMEYTVIGDAVNVASRLENMGKPLGCHILVSQDTLMGLEELKQLGKENRFPGKIRLGKLVFIPQGDTDIRGRKQPLHLFGATIDPEVHIPL